VKRYARDQRGVALVEFALVVPLVMFLVIGIVEFGLFVDSRFVISAASREGAHYLALHPDKSLCDVQAEVRKRVAPLDAATVTVAAAYYDSSNTRTVAPACPTAILPASSGTLQTYQVEVSVSYQFPPVFLLSFVPGGPSGSATLFTYVARADLLH
jgi:Flp pilus assembly protein TadG